MYHHTFGINYLIHFISLILWTILLRTCNFITFSDTTHYYFTLGINPCYTQAIFVNHVCSHLSGRHHVTKSVFLAWHCCWTWVLTIICQTGPPPYVHSTPIQRVYVRSRFRGVACGLLQLYSRWGCQRPKSISGKHQRALNVAAAIVSDRHISWSRSVHPLHGWMFLNQCSTTVHWCLQRKAPQYSLHDRMLHRDLSALPIDSTCDLPCRLLMPPNWPSSLLCSWSDDLEVLELAIPYNLSDPKRSFEIFRHGLKTFIIRGALDRGV